MLLDPLSLCHKLSRLLGPPPPSSVTYFMDGPLCIQVKKIVCRENPISLFMTQNKSIQFHYGFFGTINVPMFLSKFDLCCVSP